MSEARRLAILSLICFLFYKSCSGQSNCELFRTCGECIAKPDCSWCSDPQFPATGKRCQSRSDGSVSCRQVEDPPSRLEILDNVDISSDQRDNIVLIQPQRVKLTLRPGEQRPQKITFKTGQSKEYPLDMYFLLDLSWSMNKSKNNFAEQGGNIISDIKKITDDVRIGFGSFIDKNLPPFTSSIPSFNCPADNPGCRPPYSFYHQTSLTELSAEKFKEEVLSAPLAGNVDEPEGGLDALMQAMVCKERLGWRKESRKIILLATDRDFHYAMDGKLVGILEPNDGSCHLDGSPGKPGYYTHSNILDYPSISHINFKAQEDSYIIIFAIIPRYKLIYDELSKLITGSSVEILEKDSANIVDIITKRFQDITSSIQVQTSGKPVEIRLDILSDCGQGGEPTVRNQCNDIELGKTVTFDMSVRATKCLEGISSFAVSPVGLNQSLIVEVETLCQCDCEKPEAGLGYEPNSAHCNYRGDNACGLCQCSPPFFGLTCQCNSTSASGGQDPTSLCRNPLMPDKVCSGVGQCECGLCSCAAESGTYGTYCECDDVSCIKKDGIFCSGNGDCVCGKCVCSEDWTGDDCSCAKDTSACLSPYNRLECSGSGYCKCGRCSCLADLDKGVNTGDFCERRPDEAQPCAILFNCVECLAFKSGPLSKNCSDSCFFELNEVNMTSSSAERDVDDEYDFGNYVCTFDNSAGCSVTFSSNVDKFVDTLFVYLHVIDGEKQKCPQVNALGITLGIFGTLLLIGLATIAFWICFIRVQDYRAVARFEKEAQRVKWATYETPLYKSPVSTFQNPMFNKQN